MQDIYTDEELVTTAMNKAYYCLPRHIRKAKAPIMQIEIKQRNIDQSFMHLMLRSSQALLGS